MQNTIVKEFFGHPDVVTVLFDQGGHNGETREWLEQFWQSYYLRGGVLFDETGEIGSTAYAQPSTGLPFGRGFIIDPQGRVALPYFGHQPAMAIAAIHEILAGSAGVPGADEATSPRCGPCVSVLPQPAGSTARFRFEALQPGRARLLLFDAAGRRIAAPLVRWIAAGAGEVVLDLRPLAPGAYFYRLEPPGGSCAHGRMIRVR